MGREPQTPAEWMGIQDDAVRYLNKTKGAPSIKKDPFQGWDPKIVGKEEEKIGAASTSTKEYSCVLENNPLSSLCCSNLYEN